MIPPEMNRELVDPDAEQRRRQADTFNLWNSLQDRRTANAGFRKVEPGLRDNVFFLQQSDRRKNRAVMAGTNRGVGAMRHHANRARRCGRLARVTMGRLRPHRPYHQGQAEPSRPSHPQTHEFPGAASYFGIRLIKAYYGYLIHRNNRQVTIEMAIAMAQRPAARLMHSFQMRGKHV